MLQTEIISLIKAERVRQNQLHPDWHGDDHGLAVLTEEVGEVAKAIYEMNEAKRQRSSDSHTYQEINDKTIELKSELVQVASVCVRWLENM